VSAPATPPGRAPSGSLALIVMGVSGSGKSTLGARLAGTLDCPFLEGDAFHDAAAVARMAAGHPLDDAARWPWLDRLGMAIGAAVAANRVAVAACSALRRSYRDRLIAAIGAPTRFALLDLDQYELRRRLESRPHHYMPPSLLDSQLATLERPGTDEPVLTLDARRPPDMLCRAILDWLVCAA
jgi:gluconokinase